MNENANRLRDNHSYLCYHRDKREETNTGGIVEECRMNSLFNKWCWEKIPTWEKEKFDPISNCTQKSVLCI